MTNMTRQLAPLTSTQLAQKTAAMRFIEVKAERRKQRMAGIDESELTPLQQGPVYDPDEIESIPDDPTGFRTRRPQQEPVLQRRAVEEGEPTELPSVSHRVKPMTLAELRAQYARPGARGVLQGRVEESAQPQGRSAATDPRTGAPSGGVIAGILAARRARASL